MNQDDPDLSFFWSMSIRNPHPVPRYLTVAIYSWLTVMPSAQKPRTCQSQKCTSGPRSWSLYTCLLKVETLSPSIPICQIHYTVLQNLCKLCTYLRSDAHHTILHRSIKNPHRFLQGLDFCLQTRLSLADLRWLFRVLIGRKGRVGAAGLFWDCCVRGNTSVLPEL